MPSARRSASASRVRMEIRLRSISATSPNAKQSTLLLIVSSKEYFSLVVYRLIPRLRHLP